VRSHHLALVNRECAKSYDLFFTPEFELAKQRVRSMARSFTIAAFPSAIEAIIRRESHWQSRVLRNTAL
jgi:hypothetical protein